jgi:hypothetical protein
MMSADFGIPFQIWFTLTFFLSPYLTLTLFLSAPPLLCVQLLLLSICCFFLLSHCFRRHSCIICSHIEGPSLCCDCVDYFASLLFLFLLFLLFFCSSSSSIPFFHMVLVHIVTYCSYRTTTTQQESPTRISIHPIDHTFPLLVLVVLSVPLSPILPLDHTKPANLVYIFYL